MPIAPRRADVQPRVPRVIAAGVGVEKHPGPTSYYTSTLVHFPSNSIAVSGKPTPAALAALDALAHAMLAAQQPDGGWGAVQDRPSNTEATAFTLLALSAYQAGRGGIQQESPPESRALTDASSRALSWLATRQHPQGSWPATDQVPAPSWMSSAAVLALSVVGAEQTRARRGADWLMTQEGATVSWLYRAVSWVRRIRGESEIVDVDPDIKGWGWMAGTFSWVEPTSVAMLALRSFEHDPALRASSERASRLRDGTRLLADRMVPGGGWNYGNARVLGEDLEAYPDTTAWALLALRRDGRRDVIVPSLAALNRLMVTNSSPLARALAVLALRAHNRDAQQMERALAAQCAGSTPPGDARTRALSLFALCPGGLAFAGGVRA